MSGFTPEEVERARRYHRPRYVALVGGLALSIVTLVALVWLPLPGPWWLAALLGPTIVGLVLGAVRLPLAWWRYRHEVEWGFSTQTPRAWAADLGKESAINTLLLVGALWSLFALAHWLPHGWPWIAAVSAALLVLLLGFVAPILLEPVFNRFEPLDDEALAARLLALPPGSALMRRFERTADRFSRELTGDDAAYRALHHDLALQNLSDLRPPKWLYYWLFSHPTPPERLDST